MSEPLSTLQTFIQPVLDLLIFTVGLLDALPGYIRTLLTAVLLVWLLARVEREIKIQETRFAELFRKSAFWALLTIPLIVLLFPGMRMVVYADELPAINSFTEWLWLSILAVWSIGTFVSASLLLLAHRKARIEQTSFTQIQPETKLHQRLQHWQRRLGTKSNIQLCFSNTQRPWHSQVGESLIGLPNAAEHWPAAIQDLMLLHELCHYQKRSPRWHLASQLIACAYWPLPWVHGLQAKLDESLNLSADELSEACYRDHMGYTRSLRQIEQRFSPPKQSAEIDPAERQAGILARGKHWIFGMLAAIRHYVAQLQAFAQPETLPRWDITTLLNQRELQEVAERHSDPYDRVLVLVGQAVFLAVVLTGTTLRPMPPEEDLNQKYVEQYRLIENFHRSLEEIDAEREPSGSKTVGNVSEPVALPKGSS